MIQSQEIKLKSAFLWIYKQIVFVSFLLSTLINVQT